MAEYSICMRSLWIEYGFEYGKVSKDTGVVSESTPGGDGDPRDEAIVAVPERRSPVLCNRSMPQTTVLSLSLRSVCANEKFDSEIHREVLVTGAIPTAMICLCHLNDLIPPFSNFDGLLLKAVIDVLKCFKSLKTGKSLQNFLANCRWPGEVTAPNILHSLKKYLLGAVFPVPSSSSFGLCQTG